MANYSELLKDPRWQKMRLEIFQRDKFNCVCCGRGDQTLHVHHQYYISNRLPWEYPAGMLITLCEKCHAKEEELKDYDEDVVKVLLGSGLLRYDLQVLISLIHDKSGSQYPAKFRTIFHRVLSRFTPRKKKKKVVKLTQLLNA